MLNRGTAHKHWLRNAQQSRVLQNLRNMRGKKKKERKVLISVALDAKSVSWWPQFSITNCSGYGSLLIIKEINCNRCLTIDCLQLLLKTKERINKDQL